MWNTLSGFEFYNTRQSSPNYYVLSGHRWEGYGLPSGPYNSPDDAMTALLEEDDGILDPDYDYVLLKVENNEIAPLATAVVSRDQHDDVPTYHWQYSEQVI